MARLEALVDRVRDQQRKDRDNAERRKEVAERFRLPAALKETEPEQATPFDEMTADMDEHDFAVRTAEASVETNAAIAARSDQVGDVTAWMVQIMIGEQHGIRYGHPPRGLFT